MCVYKHNYRSSALSQHEAEKSKLYQTIYHPTLHTRFAGDAY